MTRFNLLLAAVLALALGLLGWPAALLAAHAGAPYTNVDHSNDLGNDTGDSQVEGLNAQQLNENYHGPVQWRAPAANAPAAPLPTVQTPTAPPAAPPQ